MGNVNQRGERRAAGGRFDPSVSEGSKPPTLADLNITEKQSADTQLMAREAKAVRDWMATAKMVLPARAG